MGIDEKV